MFQTRKRILSLHCNGQVIRTMADYAFFVHGKGWTNAADLQEGDRIPTLDSHDCQVESITDTGEEIVVYQMAPAGSLFPGALLWPADTLIESADGLKPIEDIRIGDRVVVRDLLGAKRN